MYVSKSFSCCRVIRDRKAKPKVHLAAAKKPAANVPPKAKTAKKATAKFSISSVATSRSLLARRSSIRSSVVLAKWNASCKSCRAVPRTTRSSSVSLVLVRPQSLKVLHKRLSTTTFPKLCATSSCTHSTSVHSLQVAVTAVTSKSA
ncbi:unannotated protein [freshwater metagenome]|uniref:Unannotated protein n=1 Tax=freshwater metagenome TaxID=449393 RepID=A0A6J6W8L7_9ZZZZ